MAAYPLDLTLWSGLLTQGSCTPMPPAMPHPGPRDDKYLLPILSRPAGSWDPPFPFPLPQVPAPLAIFRRLNQGVIKLETSGRSESPVESLWQERNPSTWNLVTRRSWRNSLGLPRHCARILKLREVMGQHLVGARFEPKLSVSRSHAPTPGAAATPSSCWKHHLLANNF